MIYCDKEPGCTPDDCKCFDSLCQCDHTHLSEKCWLSECPCKAFVPLTKLMRSVRVKLNRDNAVPD